MKVSLATLKTLGYEKELVQETKLQNTLLLVELEAKIPITAYHTWLLTKEAMKNIGQAPNLEHFTKY